ncbi:hypothetical protein HDE_08166 [Halotydeus destructor]|nr:hypothetical protein HDE_08166 [Halotydeus destructor]
MVVFVLIFQSGNFLYCVNAPDTQFQLLLRARYAMVPIGGAGSFLAIVVVRSAVEANLSQIYQFLGEREKIALKKYGFVAVAVYIVSTTFVMTSIVLLYFPINAYDAADTYYFYWNRPIRWYHITFVYVEHIYQPLVSFNWHIITISLYVYIFKAIAYAQRNNLRIMLLGKHLNKDHLNMVCSQKRLNMMKKRCDKLLGIFPFLWMASFFVRASGLIAALTAPKQTDQIGTIILLVYDAFVVLYAILSISYLEDKNEDDIDRLIVTLLRNGHGIESLDVIIQITQEKVQLTALNFFVINKSLLLNFTASLITFTVLFLQISNK